LEGRFKASLVNAEEYLLKCYRYIELNPVRAGMIASPSEYRWSSYRANGLGEKDDLVKEHSLYLLLGQTHEERCTAYRALFRTELDEEALDVIRKSANQGLPLGGERFRADVAAALGKKMGTGRTGRPKKSGGGCGGEQTEFGF
jgi:putative transposase